MLCQRQLIGAEVWDKQRYWSVKIFVFSDSSLKVAAIAYHLVGGFSEVIAVVEREIMAAFFLRMRQHNKFLCT